MADPIVPPNEGAQELSVESIGDQGTKMLSIGKNRRILVLSGDDDGKNSIVVENNLAKAIECGHPHSLETEIDG